MSLYSKFRTDIYLVQNDLEKSVNMLEFNYLSNNFKNF